VIMALLGGANSVWGPMLGVVPLVLISDFLSVTLPNYFSVVLGLVLLGIVFFVPDGIVGLLRRWRRRLGKDDLSGLLHRLADRVAGRARPQSSPPAKQDSLANGRASLLPPNRPDDSARRQ
jgi:hypothetical protein